MISFTNTIHINRPIEEVYTYLSDLEHTPEWNWAITDTKKVTPGPAMVGTRYLQTRSVPQPGTEVLEITVLEADHCIEVRGTLAEFPAHLSYLLDEKDAGTEVTNTVNLEPQRALRLLTPVLGNRIKRAVADNLNELRNRLEAGRMQPDPPDAAMARNAS
ncbi:MAG: SRPBCC family protein [Actinomycetota bacterium]|nr:SRPBCC family protein [Actinomycetota bacterium]